MKKLMAALLAAAMALCGGAALAEGAQDVPELTEPVGVKLDTARVTRRDMYELKYFDATVAPHVDELTFTVDGVIDGFNVIIGDTVKAGDVLATLNQDALEEQVDELRRRIQNLETELDFAKRGDRLALQKAQLQLDRLSAQVASGEATDAQYKLAKADMAILKAQQEQSRELDGLEITALKKQLAASEAELGVNVITAPYDGRIVFMKEMEKGTPVKAYDPVFYIADDTRLYIDSAYISASTLSAVSRVYAHIGGADYDITAREVNWQEYVAVALAGGELRTRFDFAGGVPEGMESGQYAAVFIMTGYVKDALTIPANALYSDSGSRYVYKIVGDTRVRTPVTVGRVSTISAQITDGLEEGDYVYVKE